MGSDDIDMGVMLKCGFRVSERLCGFHLEHRRNMSVRIDDLNVPARLDDTVRQFCMLAREQVQIPNPSAVIETVSNKHFKELSLPTVHYSSELRVVHLGQRRKVEMWISQVERFAHFRRYGGVIQHAVVKH